MAILVICTRSLTESAIQCIAQTTESRWSKQTWSFQLNYTFGTTDQVHKKRAIGCNLEIERPYARFDGAIRSSAAEVAAALIYLGIQPARSLISSSLSWTREHCQDAQTLGESSITYEELLRHDEVIEQLLGLGLACSKLND